MHCSAVRCIVGVHTSALAFAHSHAHVPRPLGSQIGLGGCARFHAGRRRGAAFEARDCLQEAHNLVGAQHDRHLALLTRIGDAFRHRGLAERHALEEPQRADNLVQRRPRDPRRNQMNLEGVDIFQA